MIEDFGINHYLGAIERHKQDIRRGTKVEHAKACIRACETLIKREMQEDGVVECKVGNCMLEIVDDELTMTLD